MIMRYIVARLDRIWIRDDSDVFEAGPEGEIQLIMVAATKREGEDAIIQKTGFPRELWYEAEGNGINSDILNGHDKALPIFCLPEDQMGDTLVINITAVDNDETSPVAIGAHEVAAAIGTAVAGYFGGAEGASSAAAVSGAVQEAIEESADLDFLGTVTNSFRQEDDFGMDPRHWSVTIDDSDHEIGVRYSIFRLNVSDTYANWCVSAVMNYVKMVHDGDGDFPLPFGLGEDAGDIYIRARAADRYTGEALHATFTNLPEEDVYDGDKYPSQDVSLYFNNCEGLPPFLYLEVDVIDSDPYGADEDVLGVLPLMFTHSWLRKHPGRHTFLYIETGNDFASEKAEIVITLEIWNPNADPDEPIG
jgi:hypothetical protein